MNYSPSQTVILSGVKHSGKSTIGAIISQQVNLPFYDLDDCVVDLCREDRGGPEAITWEPREIYRRLGKNGFQNLEYRSLKKLKTSLSPVILALGGGTPENSESLALLKEMGVFVYLHEKPKILYDRILSRGLPPFLDNSNPWESFLTLYKRRDALYRQEAAFTLELNGASAEEGSDRLIIMLQEYEHVR